MQLLAVSQLLDPGSEFRVHRQWYLTTAMDAYGHSRDKRTDCLQVVIALVITTAGFPLAYEALDGNTSDRITLRGFLDQIEKTYGKSKRMWVMDRGVPTEAILQEMRDPAREIFHLVGTPKGKIQQYEKKWLDLPWQQVSASRCK